MNRLVRHRVGVVVRLEQPLLGLEVVDRVVEQLRQFGSIRLVRIQLVDEHEEPLVLRVDLLVALHGVAAAAGNVLAR